MFKRPLLALGLFLLLPAALPAETAQDRASHWLELDKGAVRTESAQTPLEERLDTLRVLLAAEAPASRQLGIRLVESLWQHQLVEEVRAAGAPAGLVKRLEQYGHFAPATEPVFAIPAVSATPPARIPTVQLVVTLSGPDRAPIAGGQVRVYLSDYDLTLPLGAPATTGADGQATITVPYGKHRVVAASTRATPFVIVAADVVVDGEAPSLALRPDRRVTCTLLSDGSATAVQRIHLAPESHPFLGFDLPATGSIQVGGPITLRGELWGEDVAGPLCLRASEQEGRLTFDGGEEATAPIAVSRSARLTVRVGEHPLQQHTVQLEPGQAIRVSRGACDVAYQCTYPKAGAVEFARKAYRLDEAGLTLEVGRPLTPLVWHRIYPNKRYHDLPRWSVHLFLTDAQGHRVESVSSGRLNRTRLAIRTEDEELGTHSLKGWSLDLEATPQAPEALRYRVLSSLPLTTEEVAGSGSVELTSQHYRITLPPVLAPEGERLLEAADLIYPELRRVALGRRQSWKEGRIMTHATMPRGVRAFSSSRGTSNFSFRDVARCTRLTDAVGRIPIMHEHLHTVRYGHVDYMDLAGFRIRRRLDPEGARFMSHLSQKQAEAMAGLLFEGAGSKKSGRAFTRFLLQAYGTELFDGYLAQRQKRARLQAAGLTEAETDCVLFSQVAGEDLTGWFLLTHRGLSVERVAEWLAPGGEPLPEAASLEKDWLEELQAALADESPERVTAELEQILAELNEQPGLRSRIRRALRLGDLLHRHGQTQASYRAFRVAMEAASHVSAGVVRRTRNEALGVLNGDPLGLGWL